MNEQQKIDFRPSVEIPDFDGDFEKQMEWVKSLPEKEWLKLFEQEGSD